jgi:uncharacterized membrane protein YgcG
MQKQPAACIGSGAKWQAAVLRLGRRGVEAAICTVLMLGAPTLSALAQAQPAAAPASSSASQDFTVEQLDALLAPIALYPDPLLTQILMASAYPLDIVEAYRWQQEPANKSLTGDALTTALEQQSWDPSVKSLVPFPQVLSMMNNQLSWVQQLGYAVQNQESEVMNSIQRLRAQAQEAGQLQSNAQQVVSTEGQAIIIMPAQPDIVYVPAYNPTIVYGAWPYPAYPPVYWPPPPGYALAAGIAFGVGIAVTASLWGWARPNWGYGGINVNVNRYNNINVNRTQIHNSNWSANRVQGANRTNNLRPPSGPVGRPGGAGGGLPANAIGRSNVKVPGNITKPPSGIGSGANRPSGSGPSKPSGNTPPPKPATKPSFGGGASGNRPSGGSRQPGAFSGMNQGSAASQFGNRGAQSRSWGGGGGFGGGGRMGGGGGRMR